MTIWVFLWVILGVADLFTTYWVIGPDVIETNVFIRLALEHWNPIIGVFVVGGIIKIFFGIVMYHALNFVFDNFNAVSCKTLRCILNSIVYAHMLIFVGLYLLVIANNIAIITGSPGI